jgi:hypothetical protein
MNDKEIINGLLQLGFNSGWVVSENEIKLWENPKPQPTAKEILEASKLWDKTQQAEAQAKATARQVILDRLGLTAEEAQLLLGGN